MARELKPDAITLDVHLPDFDGWRVLDRLKVDLATRHIPDPDHLRGENTEPTLTQGTLGYMRKSEKKESLSDAFDGLKEFIERPVKNLLLVEDDEIQSHEHPRIDRQRRREDDGRRQRQRRRWRSCRTRNTTAWCSTSACPT